MTEKEKAPPMRTARPEAKSESTHKPAKRNPALRIVQRDDEDDEGVEVEGFKPLLPEGLQLEAKFIGWSTVWMFASPKVIWEFQVVEPGEYFELRFFRAFRVRWIGGRPCKRGKFRLHSGGEMYQILARLLKYKTRADRVSLAPLKNMLFRVTLRTVKTNSRQEPIPDHAQYSVIERIERG